MGIEFSAVLMVGLPYNYVAEVEDINNMIHEGTIDYASPYYDAPLEDWLIGIHIQGSGGYSYSKVPRLDGDIVEEAQSRFRDLTGMEGNLYISVDAS